MKKALFLLLLAAVSCSREPVVEYLGALEGVEGHSYQGMDVYGDIVVSCQDKGVATVYRLADGSFSKLGQFMLASAHPYNHSNVVTFGLEKADAEATVPVMYISQCHPQRINGDKDALFVEQLAPDMQSSRLVQTIVYDDTVGDYGYAVQWVIDRRKKLLYGYGNTVSNSDPENRHRVICFRLPTLAEGPRVVLHREDALEDYLIEEVSDFRFNPIGQGLYIERGKLYLPTGVGDEARPSILYIWDLRKKRMEVVDLTEKTVGELEDISRYGNDWLLQGQEGLFLMH